MAKRQRNRASPYWKAVKGYPEAPKTLGEHVRRRRLDLGLKQAEIAAQMGVHVETVKNWERGIGVPAIQVMPKLIEFLGFNPLPEPATFAEGLVFFRTVRGLTQDELARRLGVHPTTLTRWEAGHEPLVVEKRRVEAWLAAYRQTGDT